MRKHKQKTENAFLVRFTDTSGKPQRVRGCRPIQAENWLAKGIATSVARFEIRLNHPFLCEKRKIDGVNHIRLIPRPEAVTPRPFLARLGFVLNCEILNAHAPFSPNPRELENPHFLPLCVAQ